MLRNKAEKGSAMARSHVAIAFVVLAALLLTSLHLIDRLDITAYSDSVSTTHNETRDGVDRSEVQLKDEEGKEGTQFLLGVGKADITG